MERAKQDVGANGSRSRPSQKLVTKILGFLLVVTLFACGGLAQDVANPLKISISPEQINLQPGQSHTFKVTVERRSPSATLVFATSSPLTCTPSSRSNDLAPFVQDVVVTVPIDAEPFQRETLSVTILGQTEPEVVANIDIVEPAGEADFSVTASSTVAVCPPGMPSPPITFTVTALNGFAGTVSFDWVDVSGAAPSNPTPRPFLVNIAPGSPGTFTRTFSRDATHNVDLPIRFVGTLGEVVKSVTITARAEGGG